MASLTDVTVDVGQIFLLSTKTSLSGWTEALESERRDYQERRDDFLKYIQRPEALAEFSVDPLADDPKSPWNTVRQDEIIRAEIQQDVQRLPDEVNYHETRIQAMILDILFVYCKINPERGGYRQGMHELLAPLVYALEQDSIDRGILEVPSQLDQTMLAVLDSAFIEHDAYILFSRVMEHAQSFYEVTDRTLHSHHVTIPTTVQEQQSAIVERSKYIHDVCLRRADPELAAHLSNIEILPQIFIIRWIRLLFSREFPFTQLLVLWDTIFALDPSLELTDLICVAMLIRIRQQLLQADYSVCLQLLLKYPSPEQPHGPHTFVDDAAYLRNHLDHAGGLRLIMKYSGKKPEGATVEMASSSHRNGGQTARSRLTSPTRFMHPQPRMESLLQGAAKGANRMLERSEKLGINQAVRDAMGEIRRNVQSFNEVRQIQRSSGSTMSDEGAAQALAAMEKRNKQLASLLQDTVTTLKTVTLAKADDKAKSLELIEVAMAKIQFVQIYLEDSSMNVPTLEATEAGHAAGSDFPVEKTARDSVHKAGEKSEEGMTNGEAKRTQDAPDDRVLLTRGSKSTSKDAGPEDGNVPDRTDTSTEDDQPDSSQPPELKVPGQHATQPQQPEARGSVHASTQRRPAAVPTRSTLAQSSFSWMLEPDESTPSRGPSENGPKSPPSKHKKKTSSSSSRQRNAFLFGEAATEGDGDVPFKANDVFGMEPIPKPKAKGAAASSPSDEK
ncbi:hypothetical protein E4U42_007804 [Claviceps africana]|uniref:Rab-GAP TBC domain-containing protein n=1 Tax=Claviceps africana TaxID=83212 RepID=A0A8K0NFX3_9HYPO|nr:hypothetical protein E4U42_007804 [Claviceps africana]